MDTQLFTLLCNFLSLKPISSLKYPSNISANEFQDFLLVNILLNTHVNTYPPSYQYQKGFWKWAIGYLEEAANTLGDLERGDFEIDPQIYEKYISLMSPTGPLADSVSSQYYSQGQETKNIPLQGSPPIPSYITHFWDARACPSPPNVKIDSGQYKTLTLLESRTTIESGATGFRTWLASYVLARYLILHPELVSSKRVLEFGSGVGFLGIIVATLQTIQEGVLDNNTYQGTLWLTDVNEQVLERCQHNITLPCNMTASHPDIYYMKLDWFDSLDHNSGGLQLLQSHIHDKINPELILGADILYDPILIRPMLSTLRLALQPLGTPKTALIAYTKRNEETFAVLLSEIERASLCVEEVTTGLEGMSFSDILESVDSRNNVKLFRITLST